MLTRFINFITRLKISSAFNDARKLAGPMGGFFFTLGMILKIPLERFLNGYGPAITVFSASSIAFIGNLIHHYKGSNPDNQSIQLKKMQDLLSTKMILDKLNSDNNARDFFLSLKLTASDIERIENWTLDCEDNLEDILFKMYEPMQPILEKYLASTLHTLLTMSAHFIEVMLLEVYQNPDLFSFDKGITPANVALCMMGLTALLNGIVEFDTVKQSYEQPDRLILCDSIFKFYNQFIDSTQNGSEISKLNDDHPSCFMASRPT